MSTPRAISVRADAQQKQTGKRNCSDWNRAHAPGTAANDAGAVIDGSGAAC